MFVNQGLLLWRHGHELVQEGVKNYFFLLFLVFFTGILFLGTSILQSAPTTAAQSNWAGGQISNTTTDFSTWTYYSNKDSGIVAGTDIQLKSMSYSAVQTSNDGSADTCDSGGCLMPAAGFAAGTKTSTAVSGTGRGTVGLEVFYEV